MKKYHVRYYYLATGMEGRADTNDYGIIEAKSELDAKEYVVNNIDTKRKEYSLDTDSCYRHWGLIAKEVQDG